jgi:hypothetical protein
MTTEFPRVTKVEVLEDHWLRLWFTDGAIKDVNFDGHLWGPVFEPISKDRAVFESVRVDEESGTIVWPGDVDLDPDVLYGRFEPEVGPPYERREVRPPNTSVA